MFLTDPHSENKQSMIVWFGVSINWCHFYMLSRFPRLKIEVFGWKNIASPVKYIKVCECVCKCLTNAHLPPFLWLPFPLRSPFSLLQPPLSQFLLLCDLIAPFLISFDRRWLIRDQHLGGCHGNRLDQIFYALKGTLGSAWGEIMRNVLGLTALMDRAEQKPKWRYTATVSAMCVGVYVLPHFPWVHCPSHGPSGKGWSRGLFVSLCICVGVQRYRRSCFLTVQKGSVRPQ